jgi:hypothetical protein
LRCCPEQRQWFLVGGHPPSRYRIGLSQISPPAHETTNPFVPTCLLAERRAPRQSRRPRCEPDNALGRRAAYRLSIVCGGGSAWWGLPHNGQLDGRAVDQHSSVHDLFSSAHGMPQLPMKSSTISQNLARNTSPGSLCVSATLNVSRDPGAPTGRAYGQSRRCWPSSIR